MVTSVILSKNLLSFYFRSWKDTQIGWNYAFLKTHHTFLKASCYFCSFAFALCSYLTDSQRLSSCTVLNPTQHSHQESRVSGSSEAQITQPVVLGEQGGGGCWYLIITLVSLNTVESPLPVNAKNTEITSSHYADQKLHKSKAVLFSIRLKRKHPLHLIGMEHLGLGTSLWLRNCIPEQVSFLRQDP